MKYEDYIAIETLVSYRYKNNLIPELEKIITEYLFLHPEKEKYYIKKEVDLEDLIRFISSNKNLQNNLNIEVEDLLKEIIIYMEVEHGTI